MDFGFTPPDPDKAIQALDNIKAAFAAAAAAPTGAAQPLFQSLSDKFNFMLDTVIDMAQNDPNPNPQKIMMKLAPTMFALKMTAEKLQVAAQNDPRVADTLSELMTTVKNEITGIIPQGFSLPGFNLPSAGDNNKPPAGPKTETPKPPMPKGPKLGEDKPKPKKPGGGSFDF